MSVRRTHPALGHEASNVVRLLPGRTEVVYWKMPAPGRWVYSPEDEGGAVAQGYRFDLAFREYDECIAALESWVRRYPEVCGRSKPNITPRCVDNATKGLDREELRGRGLVWAPSTAVEYRIAWSEVSRDVIGPKHTAVHYGDGPTEGMEWVRVRTRLDFRLVGMFKRASTKEGRTSTEEWTEPVTEWAPVKHRWDDDDDDSPYTTYSSGCWPYRHVEEFRWAPLLPLNITMPGKMGVLMDTLGRVEEEVVATCIVRWHHVNSPTAWVGIRLGDFTDFIRNDQLIYQWLASNPIWTAALLNGMEPMTKDLWLTGWVNGDKDSVGTVTEKFIDALSGSAWDTRKRDVPTT